MFESVIKGYHTLNNKSRLKFIESLLGDENFFRLECNFYDEGRVSSGIASLQKDYAKISTEVDFVRQTSDSSPETTERLNFLQQRQLEILETMAFQSSQRLEKIPACLNLLRGLKLNFSICLEGLREYQDGNIKASQCYLEKYLAIHGEFGNHYQLNKIYGNIKFDNGDYIAAKIYLQRVTQICPEDSEVHQRLSEIYSRLNDSDAARVNRDIFKLLEE